jgi:molybdate transport system permease protein
MGSRLADPGRRRARGGVRLAPGRPDRLGADPLSLPRPRPAERPGPPSHGAAARTLGAGWLDRLINVTLPLASPGILVGGIVGYATSLGEFGAVITFAANIPGQTQTLPLAIYAALQSPGGESKAAELSMVSLTLALIGLLLSEWFGKRLNAMLGR